jgi:hypothetical protein
MNYEDIIAQALRAGFGPGMGGNPGMARVGQYQVNPYFEMTGQTEQDPGTSRQMGYTISAPLGGTTYRSDVVDMGGNLQRSNVHNAESDKYGVGDMAKLAAFAVGANALGSALGQNSMFSSGGLLGGGQAASAGAGEAAGAGFGIGGGGSTLTPAAIEAGLGTAGYGTNAAAAASGMFNPATIGAGAGLAFGPGAAAAGSAAAGGLGALGSLSGKAIGGLLGAAAGAANSGDKQQTSQQRLDPRMEALLYGADGKGGYLGAATDWFNQNKGGNPLMLQGAQMMADYYKSPQYTEGYNTLRNTGLGLLGSGMAGNPFTQPGGMPSSLGGGLPAMNMASMGGGMPQMPQAKVDAPPQAFDGGGGMMDMRYRGGPQMTPEQRRQREQDMQNMQLMAMRGFGG